MLDYGLVQKKESFWELTEYGLNCLDYFKELSNSNSNSNRIQIGYIHTTDRKHLGNTSIRKKPKQITIQPFLRNSSRDETQMKIVEVLATHLNETGGPYFWTNDVYDMADRLQVNPDSLASALCRLDEDQIVYVWPGGSRWPKKVGLKKSFIEMLREAKTSR